MSNRSNSIRGTRFRGTRVASALFAGFLVLSAMYAIPIVAPLQHGGSVHAKNSGTPEWILKLQTQNAHQLPVVVEADEPSYWI